jgi:hypothetical protein
MLPSIVAHADALEPKAFQSHSIRSLTRLLPAWAGVPTWLVVASLVLWKTARAWCEQAPTAVRFGLAMLASVLVNPHLIVYDAGILVLPLIWFATGYVQGKDAVAIETFGALLYALFLAFLVPTAALIYVQLSVPVMLWLFWSVADRAIRADTSSTRVDLAAHSFA